MMFKSIIHGAITTDQIIDMLADFDIDLKLSILSTVIDNIAIKNNLDVEKVWNTMHHNSIQVHKIMSDIED